jgi:tetratricopeptide (TPR) repeat protein
MLNGEALEAHAAGRFEEAAAGFAAAARLDPSFELTHTNLACALNRLGRSREALATLAPLLRDNPVLAYSKIASDPDLQSLAAAPEIAALLPSTPGDVQPEAFESQQATAWVGLGGAAAAVIVREVSWGSSQYRLDLEVFAAKSGARKLRLPLSSWDDRNEDGETLPARREVLRQRYEQTARWLRDMGFRADPRATVMTLASLPDSGRLKRTTLRIKYASWQESGSEVGRYDIWKDGRVVAHFGQNTHMNTCTLSYLPSARALIVQWTTEAPEGCDNGPYTFAELIPIP